MSKRKAVNKERPELMPFNMGDFLQDPRRQPLEPAKEEIIRGVCLEICRVQHGLNKVEEAIKRLYDNSRCETARNVPQNVKAYVGDSDRSMNYLLDSCNSLLNALAHVAETRILQRL